MDMATYILCKSFAKKYTDQVINSKQDTIDSNHTLDGSLVSPLTGYEKSETGGQDVSPNDSLIVALGKIEKRVSDNKNNILSEQAKTTGMTEGGSNYITVGGIRVYVSATAPTGARTGDLWIGG